MKEIKAIIQPFMLEAVLDALKSLEPLPGVTISPVLGFGKARGDVKQPVYEAGHTFVPKTKLEIVVSDKIARTVVDSISQHAHTGNVGDGKVFVYEVREAVKIRTGERGEAAI